MAKETKAAAKAPVITKNADTVRFEHAPFYNLANVRKDTLSLIVRASSDPKKVEAIAETLDTLSKFLKVRAEHAAEVRAADIAAAKAEDAAKAEAAAKHRESDARGLLKSGQEQVARAEAILADLRGAE